MSDHTIMVIWVIKTFFIQFFCVFLLPLLNLLCCCYGLTVSVLDSAHLCMKCSHGISDFLEEISSLSHPFVFLCFFALITEEGFLISSCYSLALCIQMGISFLFSFAFHFFFSQLFVRPPQTTIFIFLHFFFFGMVLVTIHYTVLLTSIHSSSGTLPNLIPWVYLSLPLYNKGCDLGHTWMV